MRNRQRVYHEIFAFSQFVDPSATQGFVGVVGRAREREFRQIAWRHGEPHDFKSQRREWHADKNFGYANAPALPRHDPAIRATGKHATARNSMTVDRRDDGPWVEKHRFKKAMENR